MATQHRSPSTLPLGDLIAKAASIADMLEHGCLTSQAQIVRELCYRLTADKGVAPHPAILPDKAASVRREAPRAAAMTLPAPDPVRPFSDGKAWCDQCDARKTMDQIKGCRSAFCKVKGLVG